MGKAKGRGDEHACRVNFLFQAGEMHAKSLSQLSQYYGKVLTVITEKTAPKKDFTMKRSMCKGCNSVLKIGDNATYRLRKNKNRKGTPNIIIGCNFCGARRRLPTTRNYKLNAEVNGSINGCGGGANVRKTPQNSNGKVEAIISASQASSTIPAADSKPPSGQTEMDTT